MGSFSALKGLKNIAGAVAWPVADWAVQVYDPASVTTDRLAASNHDVVETLVSHLFLCSSVPGIALAHLYDVQTGAVAWRFNFDQTPNLHVATKNSGSTPRVVQFWPLAPIKFTHGIGVGCDSPTAKLIVFYRERR